MHDQEAQSGIPLWSTTEKMFQIWKESFHMNSVQVRPGSRACLMALEAFGILILKYAFSHILETFFSQFWQFNPKNW